MYRISDFSKMSDTSIQTLRYYDSLSLLKPKTIGQYNNYRYYTNDELLKLKVIQKLKDMGFKLSEITKIMNKYDKSSLISRKKKLQEEINSKVKNMQELDKLIRNVKNNGHSLQKELFSLIKTKERIKVNMQEKYESAKEQLLKAYGLYQKENLNECMMALEELKQDIFDSIEEGDPFWSNSAGDLFSGITFEVFKNNSKEDVNLLNIFHFRINGKENIDNIKEYTDSLPKDSYSYICLSPVSLAPNETKASIIAVYKQKLKTYVMFESKN